MLKQRVLEPYGNTGVMEVRKVFAKSKRFVAFGMPRSPILKDLGIPSFAYSGQVLSRAVLQRSPVFCCPVLDFSSLESLSSGLFCCWHPLAGWKLADVGTGHDWPCQKK